MRHEAIVRHIEAASPEQLRLLARLALELAGYPIPRTTDGPYDGGIDLVVETAAGRAWPMAVAVSVEKNWQSKLRKDVAKARQDPSIKKFSSSARAGSPRAHFGPSSRSSRAARVSPSIASINKGSPIS
ncbi:hypothetical protein ACNOYE_24330 [Nannocystaceae bacterium ST9]